MVDCRDHDGIQLEFRFRDAAKIQRLVSFTPA